MHKIANPLAALVAAAKSKAPSLRTVADDDVPDAVVEVVDRALQFKKTDRWPDTRAFRAALKAARGETLDTFPQPGRRDPLADLMNEVTEEAILLDEDDVQMTPAAQPQPFRRQADVPPTSDRGVGNLGHTTTKTAARAASSGPERRAAERAMAPKGSKPSWQDEEDVADEATLAQSDIDPSLVQALADVRRDAVAVLPTKAVPRVGPSGPSRPSGGPPRPSGGPPRPSGGPPRPSGRPSGGPPSEPLRPAARAAPVNTPAPAQAPPLPRAKPALPPPTPAAVSQRSPSSPYVEKDPRFATVMMAGSPPLPPEVFEQRQVHRAEVVEDEATRVDVPHRAEPRPGGQSRPAFASGGAPSAPPGFAFLPPPNLGSLPGMPTGPRPPTPFEVFQSAPPVPYTPPAPHVPRGEFPGRRLSNHEDLRILVPEQSTALDHNPFADAARRKKQITIGIVVGIVALVLIALIASLRSG